jgi:predicted RNase H-like HicB family nuclease
MHRYVVVFEKAAHNWAAFSPDVPGCVATGATKDETARNMRDALEFHIEGLRAEGLPAPDDSSVESVEVGVLEVA